MLKNITNKLVIKYGTYQRGEFLPIYMDGELQNTNNYIAYKIKCTAKQLLQVNAR